MMVSVLGLPNVWARYWTHTNGRAHIFQRKYATLLNFQFTSESNLSYNFSQSICCHFFSSRLFHSFSPFRERKQKENFLCTRNKQTKKHVYVSDSRIIQWANRMQCHIYNSPIAADNNNNNGEDDGSRARFVRDKNHIAQLKDISYIYSTYLHSPSRFLLFPFWLLLLRQQPLSLLVRPSHTFSVARRQIKISKHISKNQHRLCRG